MADFQTSYLGFTLRNPLVAAACPLTGRIDGLKALEDAGIAAVTLPSLFEEQIDHQRSAEKQLQAYGASAFQAASSGYFPDVSMVGVDSMNGHGSTPAYAYGRTTEEYLRYIRSATEAVDVPVIASMNGTTAAEWLDHAKQIEQAGADALELNIYYIPADPAISGPEVDRHFVHVVHAVADSISIPLAVKIPPFFSAPAHLIQELSKAGAKAVVLFNRFVQPDIDLDSLEVRPTLTLSSSDELRMTLRWMAILHRKVTCQLAATTGAHTAEDTLKLLLAGADVVTMASALLKHGADHVRIVLRAMDAWLDDREFQSINALRGLLSQLKSPDPVAFERANYMKALLSFSPASNWSLP